MSEQPIGLAQAADLIAKGDAPAKDETSETEKVAEQVVEKPEEGETQEAEAEQPEDADEKAADGEDGEGDQDEAEDDEKEAADAEDGADELEVPDDWSDEDKEKFEKLDPAVKKFVLERAARQAEAKEAKPETKPEAEKAEPAESPRQLSSQLQAARLLFNAKYGNLDLTKLAKEDPDQAVLVQAQYTQDAQALQRLVEDEQSSRKNWVKRELQELQTRNPEYADEKAFHKAANEVAKEGQRRGYSEEELAGLSARDFETLRDAAEYRKAQEAAKEFVRKAAKKKPVKSVGKTAQRKTSAEKREDAQRARLENVKGATRAEDIASAILQ